jgi:prophage regulatory protein
MSSGTHDVMRYQDLKDLGVPYSRAHLGRLEDAGMFPKRIRLGMGKTGTVVWVRREVEGWIEGRMRERG